MGNCFHFVTICPKISDEFFSEKVYISGLPSNTFLFKQFIQDGRMVEVGRDLWVYLAQPVLQQNKQSRVSSAMSRRLLEIPKEDISRTSMGSLCKCSITCPAQKWCLVYRANFLCSSLCTVPLALSLSTTERNLSPSSLHPLFRYSCTSIRYYMSLLFSRLSSHRSLIISSQKRFSVPSA